MTGQYRARDFDWTLLVLALLIAVLGVMEIYSTTLNTSWQGAHTRQIVWVALGLLLFWLCSSIDYHWLVEQAPVFYVLSILGLVAVAAFGDVVNGSKRWLPLPGGVQLQVSEFLKVVLVLLVARFFGGLPRERPSLADLAKIGAIYGVPLLMVLAQPDLSTSLSYVPILAMGIFLSGLRWKFWAVAAVLVMLTAPLGWRTLQPYQRERLTTFLDPEADPRGTGYQSLQSKIAVGAGGIWGQGFARGTQTQLRFLPVPHTDFVFAAYAEESGFVGVLIALTLYFAILMKIVSNAQTAADAAGMHICMSVAALLLFHILVNIGMVVNKMPVTGLPLPLMSYGGSNTLSTFMLLGLVNNVRVRRYTN